MAARNSVDIVSQIGVESTPGTPVTATKRLNSLNLTLSPQIETQFQRTQGNRFVSTGVKNKGWATGNYEGIASYNEMMVILQSMIGLNQASATLATGVYQHDFNSGNFANSKVLTVERGDATAAMQYSNTQIASLNLRSSRDEVRVSGSVFAREPNNAATLTRVSEVQSLAITGTPTGGTFTLTFRGQTTSGIAHSANAATVQAALEALSTIGSGNVTCTGGALPGTAVTITFASSLANTDVDEITATSSLTGGTSPAVAVTVTTQGNYLAAYAESPISGNEVCVYLDSASGSLGSTLLTDVYETEIDIPDVAAPKWVMNCNLASFKESVKTAIENGAITVRAEYNAQMRALYDALNVNSLPVYFLRWQATGAVIASSINRKLRLDFAVKLESVQELSDQEGTYGFEFRFRIVESATWNKAFALQLINSLATL